MDREQVDDVAVVVDPRLLLAGGVAGLGGPREEGAEAAAAGARESPRAVDELLEVGDRLGRPGPVAARNSEACASRTSSAASLVRLTLGAALVQVAQDVRAAATTAS